MYIDDTISAVSTALGEGAIGIIRLSGPRSCEIADRIFNAASGKKLEKYPPNTLVYGHILDSDGIVVDESLVVFFIFYRWICWRWKCNGRTITRRTKLF